MPRSDWMLFSAEYARGWASLLRRLRNVNINGLTNLWHSLELERFSAIRWMLLTVFWISVDWIKLHEFEYAPTSHGWCLYQPPRIHAGFVLTWFTKYKFVESAWHLFEVERLQLETGKIRHYRPRNYLSSKKFNIAQFELHQQSKFKPLSNNW